MATPIEPYRQAWQRRFKVQKEKMFERKAYLLKIARKIAIFLKKEYNLTEIYLIGSLSSERTISSHSDIDLVVKGIPDEKYFSILAKIYDEMPGDVKLDLISFESARSSLQEKAIHEGIQL
ncbi:MAG: nucleotidyltransferase family protein [Promethearchaeota archaeon]